ncbi:hypothetical protein C8R44DRAFT_984288 [Mycena epipterygia]|nr:hypothetical protein C8R44DRAFT_984288 [Mycena epipterygia]
MSVSIPASYYTNIHCSCHLARHRLHRPVPCSVHHPMYNYPDRPPTPLNKGWYSFAPCEESRYHGRELHKVATVAKSAASDVKDAAGDVADAAKSTLKNTIDGNKTFDLAPITFNKNVDMDANANAQVAITAQATGTLAPPKIYSFNVVAGMTATVGRTMAMTADTTGHISSVKIPLINLGIPGLDFPGILTVGPSFTVSAQVVRDVDVTMDMTVGVNFDVNNAQLIFPPDNSTQGANTFAIGDTPLTLNTSLDVQATGTITAHLIPSLNLGVNALGGKASAQIFFALDTNAALPMNLDASGSATKVVGAAPVNNYAAAAAAGDETTADDAMEDGTSTNDTTADDTTTDETTADDTTADSTTDDSTLDPTPLDNSASSDDSTADTDTTDVTEDDTTFTDETTADDSEITDSEDADTLFSILTATAGDSTDATDDSTDASSTDDSTDAMSVDDSTDTSLDPTTLDNSASTDGTDATADWTTDGTTDDTTATDGTDSMTDDTTTDASGTTGSIDDSVQLNAGINVNTGISGSFFNLFNTAKTTTLFSKDFLIFNKCFGDQATQAADATATATTRRSVPRLSRLDRQRWVAFTCPALGLAKPVSVTKGPEGF